MERQKLIIITIVIFVLIVFVIIAYLCVRSKDEFVDGERALISTDNKNLNIIDKTTFDKFFFDQLYPPGSIYVGTGNFPGYPFNSSEWEQINSNLLVGADGVGGTTSINEMLGYNANYQVKFQEDGGGIVSLNKWKRKCDNCVPTQQKQPMTTVSRNDINNVNSVGWSTYIAPNAGDNVLMNEGFWESADNTYNDHNPVTLGPLANYLICIQNGNPIRIYGQYLNINFQRIKYTRAFLKTGDKSIPNEIYIIAKTNDICHWTILALKKDINGSNSSYEIDLENTGDFDSYGILVTRLALDDKNVCINKLFFFNDAIVTMNHIKSRASSVSKLRANDIISENGGYTPDISSTYGGNVLTDMLFYLDNSTLLWHSGKLYKNSVDGRYDRWFPVAINSDNNSGEFIKFEFDKKFILSKMYVNSYSPYTDNKTDLPSICSVYASNDEKNWSVIGGVGPSPALFSMPNVNAKNQQLFNVWFVKSSNAGAYKYYVLQVNRTRGGSVIMSKFQFFT